MKKLSYFMLSFLIAFLFAFSPGAFGADGDPVLEGKSGNVVVGAGGSVDDAAIPGGITRDSEWDSEAKIETAITANIIVATEIDSESELEAIMGALNLIVATEINTEAKLETLLGAIDVIVATEIGSKVQAYDADLAYLAGVTPSDDVKTVLNAANKGAVRTALDLEAGTDFYSMTAADTAFEAELVNSAGLRAALNDETGSGAAVFGDSPALATPTITGDVTGDGGYYTGLQNISDLNAKGPAYWFDGIDDYIDIGDQADLEFDTKASFIVDAKLDSSDIASNYALFGKYASLGNQREYILVITDAEKLRVIFGDPGDGTYEGEYLTDTGMSGLDQNTSYAVTYNAGTVVAYHNGNVLAGTSTTIPTSLYNGSAVAQFGSYASGSYPFGGHISRGLAFNLTLSAAEVRAFSSGSLLPYMYIGASQTEFMTTAEDRNFTAGTSDWLNPLAGAAYATFLKVTDLSLIADGVGDYTYITFTNIGTVLEKGKRYRFTYDYAETVGGFEFKLGGDAIQTLGAAVAGTGQSVEFTADEDFSGPKDLRIISTTTTSEGDFDNLSILQIGCVGDWTGNGIGHQQWQDMSGNQLVGTVSAAIATNLPANHQEKYLDLTVTDDTSFILPKGYMVTSIILVADGAIGGGIDIGTTDGGGELVTAQAVAGASTIKCTLVDALTIGATHTTADDTFYITDADGTGWDGASLEVRVEMQRLTVN